ncbi:MAG: AmmeMemoRadiSam system protein B [Candidatus Omnitrophica bacterium]|nr:AmmeMemoRadiSam system protein B [Candidatus Omnitrophota bacterium]MDD5487351.1 AmmeMemoRadiSam system protein B [Candidatus Omnitrophota bacterium]
MARRPVVEGCFYPSDTEDLSREIKALISVKKEARNAIGIVAPHAGYVYSGGIAGKVYGAIRPARTYVVLGPNHTGRGEAVACSDEDWETPLGTVEVDKDLIRALTKGRSGIKIDRKAHAQEHAVEVHLPFIKSISPEAKIVPITFMSVGIREVRMAGEAIASAIKASGGKALIVASSDMTHYESRASASKKDKEAIGRILELDAEGLLEVVEEHNISMCGVVPVAVMLVSAKELGARAAELIEYDDSGSVNGDTSHVVGYAGLVVC